MLLRFTMIAMAAMALTVFQESLLGPFVPGLGDAPLALIIALILTFRFGEATLAAVASSLLRGPLTTTPGAVALTITLVTVALLIVLYTRVFTDLSVAGFIAMTVVSFVLWFGLFAGFDAAHDSIRGLQTPSAGFASHLLRFGVGMGSQMFFGVIALAFIRRQVSGPR